MLEVLIENLIFPKQEITSIFFHRNGDIEINLEDYTKGRNNKQYDKWINLCGNLQNTIIEQLSIGKNHFDENFHFNCSWNNGIPELVTSTIQIRLKIVKGGN